MNVKDGVSASRGASQLLQKTFAGNSHYLAFRKETLFLPAHSQTHGFQHLSD